MRPVTVILPNGATWKTRKPNTVGFSYRDAEIRIPKGYKIGSISNYHDRVVVRVEYK